MEATTTTIRDTACDGECGEMHPADEMTHFPEGASLCVPCDEARLAEMAAACGVRLA